MKKLAILLALLALFGLSGCGSWDSGSDDETPPPVEEEVVEPTPEPEPPLTTGTVTGHILAPNNLISEVEPNTQLSEANLISEDYLTAGSISISEDSNSAFGPAISDLFLVNITEPSTIVLGINASPSEGTVRIHLLDQYGVVLDSSDGTSQMEKVNVTTEGDYYIGLEAVSGQTPYTLGIHAGVTVDGDFVPGEIIVRYKDENYIPASASVKILRTLGKGIKHIALNNPVVVMGKSATEQNQVDLKFQTLQKIKELKTDPNVLYAEPNYYYYPDISANDLYYTLQWNLNTVRIADAWNTTVGSDDVIVAVIDTGIRNHNDFENIDATVRYINGYDFISDHLAAYDGDGIDADATDSEPTDFSHGTAVASVIAAATNNYRGMSGLTWNTKIMPIRALNSERGTSADLAQAILYACGLPNTSGTVPAKKADIINMSFGATSLAGIVADAIADANAAGCILVGSAGNEGINTPYYPGMLPGVIAVGASTYVNEKASYSNFGDWVDVAAPGGELADDVNNDNNPDGILINYNLSEYGFAEGTSFAAPMVAGIVALMKDQYPALTTVDVEKLLANEHPGHTGGRIVFSGVGGTDIGNGKTNYFGYGIIDANKAVLAAKNIQDWINEPDAVPQINPTFLNYGYTVNTIAVNIANTGGRTLTITDIVPSSESISVNRTEGVAPATVNVTVLRTTVDPGEHEGSVTFYSTDGINEYENTINLRFAKVDTATLGDIGSIFVQIIDPESSNLVDYDTTTYGENYVFRMEDVERGTYNLLYGTDRDSDGEICEPGDFCNQTSITVRTGIETGSTYLTILPVLDGF